MKKFIFAALAAFFLFGASAGAANVGDKISEAVYSDLSVYVNHYPIPAYVVNDYAVIVAEDLADYCCDVLWDGNARTLNITKSADKTEFTSPAVYNTSFPTGTKCADVLYTDIKTYVNGTEVTSFNVNGRTMIVIDEFGNNMDGYAWVPDIRAAKAWLDGKHIKDYAPLTNRTELLFYDDPDDHVFPEEYTGQYDFDFDGTNESISLNVISSNQSDKWTGQTMQVTIGNRTTSVETVEASISAVYVCDIDATDGVKDIAVITTEASSDPFLRIFRYDNSLSVYKFEFKNYWDDETSILEYDPLGYVDKYYLNVNDDGSITIEEQTDSAGMWEVLKKYYRDSDGIFKEQVPQYYEILPIFMENILYWSSDLTGYERTMWEKGYIKSNVKYQSNGFTINKGEYFKVIYDDGNDYIYVVKENGSAGWIYIGYDADNRYKLNDRFFYLAG